MLWTGQNGKICYSDEKHVSQSTWMNVCAIEVEMKDGYTLNFFFAGVPSFTAPPLPLSDAEFSSLPLFRFFFWGFLCAALGLGGLNVGDTVVKLLLENGAVPNVILGFRENWRGVVGAAVPNVILGFRENWRGVVGASVAAGVRSASSSNGKGNESSNALSSFIMPICLRTAL